MIIFKKLAIFFDDINIFIFKHYVRNNDKKYNKIKKLLDTIEKTSDTLYDVWYRLEFKNGTF